MYKVINNYGVGFRVIIREHKDIEDLLTFIKTTEVNEVFKGHGLSSNKPMESHWHETQNLLTAMRYLEYGYDKHFKEIKNSFIEAKNTIKKFEQKNKKEYENSVEGFLPIVPNSIIGLPNSMIRQKKEVKTSKSAKIFIDVGASAGVDKDRMIKYRTLILAIVDLLQMKGIRCEIYAVDTSIEDDEIYIEKLKLKEYGQPLNIYKMQFPIISPDMTRRIFFRTKEVEPEMKNGGWFCGYGCPLTCSCNIGLGVNNEFYNSEDLMNLLNMEKDDIYFPAINDFSGCESYDEFITKLLKVTTLLHYIKI